MDKTPMVGGAYTHDNTNPPTSDRGLQLFSCKGKTAIVSGAGAGIGLAVAQVLAEFGANVAIWFNKNQSALDRATEIEKEYGVRCKAYKVDVTSAEQVQASVDAVVQDLNGRLDIFVAAAGMFPEAGPILDLDIDNYRGAMAGNLDSTFYCARATGKHWRRQKREGTDANGQKLENFTYGTFVATASLAGGHIVEVPDLAAAYSIAKAGVIQLCKSLAVEWIQFARINSVSPGVFTTPTIESFPMDTRKLFRDNIPMGREGEVHELKGIYLYLSSDASSFTTGTETIVDGGQGLS